MSYLIAIVEDDADQRRNYCAAIENKGFETTAYANRSDALKGIQERQPDLAVLDIILESEVDGGFMLCRDLLAQNPDLPIIFLTERVDEIDKISGLRLGAWDYQPKPISATFLAERVASLLRLKEVRSAPESNSSSKTLGDLSINESAMQASWCGERVDLTLTEFRLLAHLLRVPGEAVTYDSLMKSTIQSYVTSNTINTHMRNIRKKFRQLDDQFDCIKNEYGFGYRWAK
ncbi:response regulator [bacterium SCSIO 12696]|nr:response regulator [bacterium SCSIO 12696]